MLRVGRGGPRWREALGGSPVQVRVRDGRVHVTVWLIARPRQRLVPLTDQVQATRSPARSSGCSGWSSAGSRSWSMASGADAPRPRRDRGEDRARSRRAGRRLALAAVFEAEFGQRTADAILERHLATEADPETGALARELVANVVRNRDSLDARITRRGPPIPGRLARPDGPRAAPLRPVRGATLARDAGPGGHCRVGRARQNLLWRSDATAHERRARAGGPRPGCNPSGHPGLRRESVASTYDRLKKIVIEQLGVDEAEVTPEASFVDDLNADSLDLVELIMSLEEEFGTEISDEDAEKIRTVQDAVDYIDERSS